MRWLVLVLFLLFPMPGLAQDRGKDIDRTVRDKALQEEINRAVKNGVDYLREQFGEDGAVKGPRHREGVTALAAYTLLESGVKADDPLIQKAADYLRTALIEQAFTYATSLGVLFLDKLGDPSDVLLIEALAYQLLQGQNLTGGWTYGLTVLDEAEQKRLTAHIQKAKEQRKKGIAAKKDEKRQLSPQIVQRLRQLQPGNPPGAIDGIGDNSNTHFAMLGLWVAGRHGMPVDDALLRVGKRFRATQQDDDGWSYLFEEGDPRGSKPSRDFHKVTPAMTCVALIGLGLEHGVMAKRIKDPKKARDVTEDPAVKKGLILASRAIGDPAGSPDKAHRFGTDSHAAGDNYYYLWCVERMAVIYNMKTIGDKDWYSWGAEILVANQDKDGNWSNGKYDYGPDACFALLFLKKANVAADIKVTAKDIGKVIPAKKLPFELSIPIQRDSKREPTPPAKEPEPVQKEPVQKEAVKVEPKKPAEPVEARLEAVKLTTALLEKPAAEHDAILAKIGKAEGAAYTQVLASTIPQLPGATQVKARTTLAQRLAALPAADLRKEMKGFDGEIRRAAARAAALAKVRSTIPDLIELLADPDAPVSQAAHESLRQLTGQDFGPKANATRAGISQAVADWRAWWKKQ